MHINQLCQLDAVHMVPHFLLFMLKSIESPEDGMQLFLNSEVLAKKSDDRCYWCNTLHPRDTNLGKVMLFFKF